MKFRRREVLKSSLVGVVTTLAPSLRAESTSDSVLVDTHLHCFAGLEDARFPYHERAPYRPAEAATPQRLLQLMDAAGVAFAVVVHPEPYQDDHRYLEHCLDVGSGRLKGTLLLFADRPGSLAKLPKLVSRLDVVSLRVHAYAPDRLPPFGQPELRQLWRLAGDHGLAVELHLEPRYAPQFEGLIREFSGTRVIIDHLGRPMQGTPEEHAVIVRWARFDNTIMKMSSLPSMRSYPHRDVRPIVRRLTDAYGADRMIYGGGFNASATAESYAAAFQTARDLLSHLPVSEQDRVLGKNAVRLFSFQQPD